MGQQATTPVMGLRGVFATELSSRLPRLVAALAGTSADLEAARRDAHTLGTSAVLVGEPEIARLARLAEVDLDPEPLAALVAMLRAWTP